jgi:hypothetical protein
VTLTNTGKVYFKYFRLQITKLSTFAFPMGRQKLESRTSAETGNDSPYLEHITHQINYHLKLEIMLKTSSFNSSFTITNQGAQLTIIHFQGKLQDQGPL